MTRYQRIKSWAQELDVEQVKELLVELVDDAIEAESICFHENALVPYWETTGEPLIDGQQTYPKD